MKIMNLKYIRNTVYIELNVCIDFDNCFVDEEIEKIITFWNCHNNENY